MANETAGNAESTWLGEVTQPQEPGVVRVDGRVWPIASCPTLESLARRHEASDKHWTGEWVEDEVDPTEPF